MRAWCRPRLRLDDAESGLSGPIPAGHGEPFWRLPFQGDDLTHLGGFGSIARERLADSVVPVSAFDSAHADGKSNRNPLGGAHFNC